jgi:hypothetical protein
MGLDVASPKFWKSQWGALRDIKLTYQCAHELLQLILLPLASHRPSGPGLQEWVVPEHQPIRRPQFSYIIRISIKTQTGKAKSSID